MNHTIENVLDTIFIGPITLAFWASNITGIATGALVTLLIALPGIILDLAVNRHNSDYELHVFEIPRMLNNCGENREHTVYRGGFFSKYPLGYLSEKAGLVVNAGVSASVFVGIVSVCYSLVAAAIATALSLLLAVILLSALVFLVRCCIVGPSNAEKEFGLIAPGPA